MAEPLTEDELTHLLELVGPKRVKSKDVEVESHDPLKMQNLLERRKSKPVLFGNFAYTKVVPKCTPVVCRDDDCSSGNCGC